MGYDTSAPGIHVRGSAETLVDAPDIARLTVQVWPIPYDIAVELHSFIGAAVAAFMEKRGLASGEVTDLTARGPIQ